MIDLEIRQEIARYIDGHRDARDLEDWLENVAWGLRDEPGRTLAATTLRLLAEHANGDWTDSELREKLGAVSRIYAFDQTPRAALSGSASNVIRQEKRSATADRWRVAESV